MGMNIKKPDIHKAARRLAKLTGESLTTAVDIAVRERLERVLAAQNENDDFVERVLRIGRDCAKRLKEPYRSIDHADLLYDERGLPK